MNVTDRGRLGRLFAGGAASAALAMALTGPPAYATDSGWRLVHTVNYAAYTALTTVVPLGRSDVWAFGAKNSALSTGPLALQWNGKTWADVSLPVPGDHPGKVTAADASSPANMWAAGDNDGVDPYALRWDGTRWSVAETWPGGGQITGLAALGPSDVWIFGAPGANPGVGTWHFDGTAWNEIDAGFLPATASAVSGNDIWAVGRGLNGDSRTLGHYDGTSWSLVELGGVLPPDIDDGDSLLQQVFLVGVKAVAGDVWVTGTVERTENGAFTRTPFLLHRNGDGWQSLNGPDLKDWAPRPGLESDGAGGLWVPGNVTTEDSITPVLMHRSASGTWSAVKIGGTGGRLASVADVASLPGTTSAWGVGDLRPADQSTSDGAIYSYRTYGTAVPDRAWEAP